MRGLDPRANSDDACERRERTLIADAPLRTNRNRDSYRASRTANRVRFDLSVAVRSSATAEDLPTASFAGQHEVISTSAAKHVVDAYRQCLASLFTERAIHYRIDQRFDHFKVALSVGIMKMVRSDLACSGVAFTLDTESGFRESVLITGSYGLGRKHRAGRGRSGRILRAQAHIRSRISRSAAPRIGSKTRSLDYGIHLEPGRNTPTSQEQRRALPPGYRRGSSHVRRAYASKSSGIIALGPAIRFRWSGVGERRSRRADLSCKRAPKRRSRRSRSVIDEYRLQATEPVLTGEPWVRPKIAAGPVRIVHGNDDLALFRPGEVLVAATYDA